MQYLCETQGASVQMNGTAAVLVTNAKITLSWAHTEVLPANTLRGFRIVMFTGTDPNDTSKYYVPPIEVGPNERSLVKYVTMLPSTPLKAAIQSLYIDGNESAWRVTGGTVTGDPDTVALPTDADLQAVADAAAADATTKANAAQAAAISSAATTAMQKASYTIDGVKINGITLAGGSITAAAMANSNSTNLIPNGNSDTLPPVGAIPNYLSYSQQQNNAFYTKTGITITTGIADPVSGTNAYRLAATTSNAQIYSPRFILPVGYYTNSVWVRRVSGSGTISVISPSGTTLPIAVTGTWTRFSAGATIGTNGATWGVLIATSGDTIDIAFGQIEYGGTMNAYSATSGVVSGWPSGSYEGNWLDYTGTWAEVGKGARHIANNGSWQYTAVAKFMVNASEQFFLSCRNYSDNAAVSCIMGIEWHDHTGAMISSDTVSRTSSGWLTLSGSFTAPATAASAYVLLGSTGANGTHASFDTMYCGKVIVAGMLAANSVVAGNISARAIVAGNLVVANLDNLCPNPNSEDPAPTGGWPSGALEAVGLYDGYAYQGGKCRRVLTTASFTTLYLTPKIPANVGDQFQFEAYTAVDSYTGSWRELFCDWLVANADGSFSWVSGSYGEYLYSNGNISAGSGSWVKTTLRAQCPVGATHAVFGFGGVSGGGSGIYAAIDQIYIRRCADAGLIVDGAITALFARIGNDLTSTNYKSSMGGLAAGGVGHVDGFKLSGQTFDSAVFPQVWAYDVVIGSRYLIYTPGNTNWVAMGAANNNAGTIFTATARDAAMGSGFALEVISANMEIGNSITIGGYKAAVIANGIAGRKIKAWSGIADPTGTSSTTGAMMGIGSTCKITPNAGGNLLLCITGTIQVASTPFSAYIVMVCDRTEWNAAPANGAAIPAITTSASMTIINANGSARVPFTLFLAVPNWGNREYWIDIGVKSNSSGLVNLRSLVVSAAEIM